MKIGIIDERDFRAAEYQKKVMSAIGGTNQVNRIPFEALVSDFKKMQTCNYHQEFECSGFESGIDEQDILIVDKDLRYLGKDEGGMIFSGEQVAFFARLMLDTKLIVGVNQRDAGHFNLELAESMNSHCDLSIDPKELENKGLWGDENWGEFRPWYWPILPKFAESHARRVDFVMNHFDSPILESLGLTSAIERIEASTLKYLGKDPLKQTFWTFIEEAENGLNLEDIEAFRKSKDSSIVVRKRAAGFVAARLAKWLNHQLLACQYALVDAPHLVDLFPSLYTGNKWDNTDLAKLAILDHPGNIDENRISSFEFKYPCWLARRCWVVSKELADELKVESHGKHRPFRFCEDTSLFHPESDCHIYDTQLPSRNSLRCVKVVNEEYREYSPEDWLL